MSECDEITIAMDTIETRKSNAIATKKTETMATNVASTASINCNSKKVRYCYILHTV